MKKLLSLVMCLLLIASLTLPVLATEEYWEAEVDTEETEEEVYIQWGNGVIFEQPEDGAIAISPWDSESGEVYYEFVPVDPENYYSITVEPEEWEIGAIDGELVLAPSTLSPIGGRASSLIPSAILAVIAVLAIILAVVLLVIIVVIAIVLIIKSARKKKNVDIEAE